MLPGFVLKDNSWFEPGHEHFDTLRAALNQWGPLTIVHGPHESQSEVCDVAVGLLTGDQLPQDDAPTEHVTFLSVNFTCCMLRNCWLYMIETIEGIRKK